MLPEHTALRHAIAAERARLLVLLWHDIAALRQLADESRQLVDATRHSWVLGMAAARCGAPSGRPIARHTAHR